MPRLPNVPSLGNLLGCKVCETERMKPVVVIEYAMVKFKGQDQPRRWDLRVTEVFEQRDGSWLRAVRR